MNCVFGEVMGYSTSSDIREAKRAIEDAKNARKTALPITIRNITAEVFTEVNDELWGGCEVTTGGDIIVQELPSGKHNAPAHEIILQLVQFLLANIANARGVQNLGDANITVNYNGKATRLADAALRPADVATPTIVVEHALSQDLNDLVNGKVAGYFMGATATIREVIILKSWDLGAAGWAMIALRYTRATFAPLAGNLNTASAAPDQALEYGTVGIATDV